LERRPCRVPADPWAAGTAPPPPPAIMFVWSSQSSRSRPSCSHLTGTSRSPSCRTSAGTSRFLPSTGTSSRTRLPKSNIDDGRLGERLEPLLAQFSAHARLLRAEKRDVRPDIEMLVHPDHAGVDPGRHLKRALAVRRPDRASQAVVRVVGPCDRVVNVGKAHYREHRAELLLANKPGVVGDVADDGRPDEIARSVDWLAASDDLAVPPCVLEERLNLLELHMVLNRAHLCVFLETIADDGRLCEPTQLVTNGVVDRIVGVDPFDGNAG